MDETNRFKHLLDPIRDLASNWDIDIADELGNYLEELETLTITFDDGQTNLNFAEAALVIAGSTAIYSKKVEYLHQLVMKALEYISNQRQGNKSSNSSNKQRSLHMSIEEDERMLFTNDIANLLVDDVLEEAQNIDLESNHPSNAGKRINSLLAHKNDDTKSGDYSRSSVLLMHSLLQEDQGHGNLKMSSCRMDASGILMLGNLPVEGLSSRMNLSMNASMTQPYQHHDDNHFDEDMQQSDDYAMQMSPSPAAEATDHIPFSAKKPSSDLMKPSSPSRPITAGINHDNFIRSNLGTRPQAVPIPTRKLRPTRQLLDPHEETKDSRAVKKGVCYHVPKKLQNTANTNEVSDDTYRLDFQTYIKERAGPRLHRGPWNLDSWLSTENKQPTLPMTGFLIPSFAKLSTKNRSVRVRDDDDQDDEIGEFIYRDPVEDHDYSLSNHRSRVQFPQVEPPSSSALIGEDPRDDLGYWDSQPYENVDGNQPNPSDDAPHDNFVADADIIGASNALDDDDEAILAQRVEKILNEELSSSLTSSYKMICDKMILDFKRGVERYAKETNLSRRVSDWTNRIEPLLLEQEKMPVFDIHDYSDRILVQVHRLVRRPRQRKDDSKEVMRFDDILSKGQSSGEVCRMFLACLQLANMGNLLIIPPPAQTMPSTTTTKGSKTSHAAAVALVDGSHDRSFFIQLLDVSKKIDIENYVISS